MAPRSVRTLRRDCSIPFHCGLLPPKQPTQEEEHMPKENSVIRCFARTVGGVSAALALTSTALAQAQSVTASSSAPVQMQAYEVTGSSIKRMDAQTALPVLV